VPKKYLDPSKILAELTAVENNKAKINALADELWRVVEGPTGLADTIGEMLSSFDGNRVGHNSQIRLIADIVRLLERAADQDGSVSDMDPEDLEAVLKNLMETDE